MNVELNTNRSGKGGMRTWLERATKTLARDESAEIAKALEPLPRELSVLDVGCGFGRKMRLLQSLGFSNVEGVEKNTAQVKLARQDGLRVHGAEEFCQGVGQAVYDLLVMAHVIEHFPFDKLLEFLDDYLDRLRPGGWLLVVSPLMHKDFFLDFDHVKPYYPQGIKDFFGKGDEQVQSYSRHTLQLVDIRFRRSPWRLRLNRALILKRGDLLPKVCNFLLALAFRCSGKLLGHKTGWIGLYRKR
ncbi:class I SAM-dependent methyltransferase [Desulfocurvibacter africanus]|uniref:class I SAM-dependent methyltransferase n=1 Tax=Desulfocurvibacter africanus TaxID=873 RepID=UPI002FDA479B